jgi:hypothetical protein
MFMVAPLAMSNKNPGQILDILWPCCQALSWTLQ